MKRFVWFSMLGLLLMNCTNQEQTIEDDRNVPTASSFLSVSIVSAGTSGTRAENDEYDEGNGHYKDGMQKENYVKDVLLLFFYADGKPAQAYKDNDGTYTYYHWVVDDGNTDTPDHKETVEKVIEETVTITLPYENNEPVLPTQLLAVVNPPANYAEVLVDKPLDELRSKLDDYETYLDDRQEKEGQFVMTNSVYVDKDGKVVDTTPLTKSDFNLSANKANPQKVVIYVERVLARIDLKIANDLWEKKVPIYGDNNNILYYIFPTGTVAPTAIAAEEPDHSEEPDQIDEEVYVRLLGWNVFDTPSKSRLMKKVNAEWLDNDIFGSASTTVGPWNAAEIYHRSFWAMNPPKSDAWEYKTGAFTMDELTDKDITESDDKSKWNVATKYPIPAGGASTTAYFQENAAPVPEDDWTGMPSYEGYVTGAPVKPSKVVIAAQLVDKSGKPRELAKWAGKYYYSWEGLKIHFCNNELNDLRYLTSVEEDGKTTYIYKPVEPKDLTYTKPEGSNAVTVVVNDEVKQKSQGWFIGNSLGDLLPVTNDDVDQYIATQLGEKTVQIWNDGYAYFHFAIRHLGAEGSQGYYGVVRNHIYEASVKSISGVGTSVLDPREDIEVTTSDDTGMLYATVKILSWRMVQQGYDLNW